MRSPDDPLTGEAGPELPEPKLPFDSQPASFPGCGKPLVIGCTVVLVLLAVGSLVLLSKMPQIFRWTMERYEEAILESLPEDVGEAERGRLRAAFAAASEKMVAGEVEPAELQEFLGVLRELSRRGGKLTREDVSRLTEALESIAGRGRPEPVPEPTPAPETAPTI